MSPRQRHDPHDDDQQDPGGGGGDGRGDDLEALVAELREEREGFTRRLDELERRDRRGREREAPGRGSGSAGSLERALRDAGYDDLTEDDLIELRKGKRRTEVEGILDDWLKAKGAELAAEADAEQERQGKAGAGTRSRGGAKKSGGEAGAGGDGDSDGDGDEGGRRGRYFS